MMKTNNLKKFREPIKKIASLVEKLDSLENDVQYENVAEALIDVKAQQKAIKAELDEATAEPRAEIAKVKATFDPTIEDFRAVEELCKGLMSVYLVALSAKAEGLRAAAAKTKDPARVETLLRQADALEPLGIKGISVSPRLRVDVLDTSAVPAEFKKTVVDEVRLSAAVADGIRPPGVRVTTEYQISVTPSRAGKVIE